MIRLYPARVPADASRALLKPIKDALQRGRVFLVVPNQFTVEAEQMLFDRLETDVLMNVQVKSFASLVRDILESGAGRQLTVISEQGRRMLLRHILLSRDDWSFFTRGTRGEGLLDLLQAELREWKEYGITPDRVRSMAAPFAEEDPSRQKFNELADVYAAYEEALARGLVDQDDQLLSAFQQLASTDVFRGITFFFDRFHSMSKVEREALRLLHAVGHDLHIALTLDPRMAKVVASAPTPHVFSDLEAALAQAAPDADAFQLTARFQDRLMELGPTTIETVSSGQSTPSRFRQAAQSLFSYGIMPEHMPAGPEEGEMRFMVMRNSEEEIDHLGVWIKKRIELGARYQDFAVILSDGMEYGSLVEKSFRLEGIPFFLDRVQEVNYHPLLQVIRSLFAIARYGMQPEAMLALVRAGFVAADEKERDAYQSFVLRRRIRYGMFAEERYFTADPFALPIREDDRNRVLAEYETARSVNQRLLDALSLWLMNWASATSMESLARGLVLTLRTPALFSALETYGETLDLEGEGERLEAHHQIWNQIMQVLDEAVVLFPGEMDREQAAILLEEGMRGISAGVIPPYVDRVFVGDWMRSRIRPRRFVALVGMSDLYVPKAHQEMHFLTEEEKRLLAEKGEVLPSTSLFAAEEERLNLYTALHQAKEGLFVTAALQTMQNEPMEPSDWMQRLAEGAGESIHASTLSWTDLLRSRKLRNAAIPRILREEAAESETKERAMAALRTMRTLPELKKDAQQITRALERQVRLQPLDPSLVRALYPSSGMSASALEAIARCPYHAFVQYGLRPAIPTEVPVEAREFGDLLHRSIDAWTAYVAGQLAKKATLDPKASRAAVEKAWKENLSSVVDAVRREDPRNLFSLREAHDLLLRTEERLLRQITESGVARVEHEIPFGPGAILPSVPLIERPRSLVLRGKIDRIDQVQFEGQSFVAVTDYKTGHKTFDLADTLRGTHLQLPLYLRAAQPLGLPLGAFYLPVHLPAVVKEEELEKARGTEEKLSGFLLNQGATEELDPLLSEKAGPIALAGGRKDWTMADNALQPQELERLVQETMDRARSLAEAREAGDIRVAPYLIRQKTGRQGCLFCPYAGLCHFEHHRDYGRQRIEDPITWKKWREDPKGGEA